MTDLVQFQSRLGHVFQDVNLLTLALTHPSLTREDTADSPPVQHNQRLEFLGDAVLQLVLTGELYHKFPDHDEGPLTQARAEMVNRKTLARQGRRLELGQHLRMSRGEEQNGGRDRDSALADAFEAVMGALYLDAGFEAARKVMLQLFHEEFGELEVMPSLSNPKGDLQEALQTESAAPPTYSLISADGPDHARIFECTVHHGGEELGRGKGKSKKAAESAAALAALENLKNPPPEAPPDTPLTNA
jgi:ribonuclease III